MLQLPPFVLDGSLAGMDDDSDSDVHFEDEWEEVPGPQAPLTAAAGAAQAADTGDILVNLRGALWGL